MADMFLPAILADLADLWSALVDACMTLAIRPRNLSYSAVHPNISAPLPVSRLRFEGDAAVDADLTEDCGVVGRAISEGVLSSSFIDFLIFAARRLYSVS